MQIYPIIIQLLFFDIDNGVMDGHTTMEECKRTVNFKSKVLFFIVVISRSKLSSCALKDSNHYLALGYIVGHRS